MRAARFLLLLLLGVAGLGCAVDSPPAEALPAAAPAPVAAAPAPPAAAETAPPQSASGDVPNVDARPAEIAPRDIVFVVDASLAMGGPSGGDIDGDGVAAGARVLENWGGGLRRPAGDSVLAAQLAAVRGAVAELDPGRDRAGLVLLWSDPDPQKLDALTIQPLTNDRDAFAEGTARVQREGVQGARNLSAGIHLGAIELLGLQTSQSPRRKGAQRILVLISGGRAQLPRSGKPEFNAEVAVDRARRLETLGVRIDTYALGLDPTRALEQIAQVTGGSFTHVPEPAMLPAVLAADFAPR